MCYDNSINSSFDGNKKFKQKESVRLNFFSPKTGEKKYIKQKGKFITYFEFWLQPTKTFFGHII